MFKKLWSRSFDESGFGLRLGNRFLAVSCTGQWILVGDFVDEALHASGVGCHWRLLVIENVRLSLGEFRRSRGRPRGYRLGRSRLWGLLSRRPSRFQGLLLVPCRDWLLQTLLLLAHPAQIEMLSVHDIDANRLKLLVNIIRISRIWRCIALFSVEIYEHLLWLRHVLRK